MLSLLRVPGIGKAAAAGEDVKYLPASCRKHLLGLLAASCNKRAACSSFESAEGYIGFICIYFSFGLVRIGFTPAGVVSKMKK